LIEQHGLKWRWELPNIEGITWEDFRRGFVATATFASVTVLKDKASVCWAAAPIESISIRWPRSRDSIDNITPIAGLRELSFNVRAIDRRDVARFADSPLLSTLHTLNIRKGSIGVEGFQRLVASPHLGNLKALRVPGNSIGNGAISALFDAVSLTSLEELDLSEVDNYGRYGEDPILEAVGAEALAVWPGMNRLRSLTLSGNSVGREGLRALLRSPRATGLKELILRDNGLNGQAMQEFGAARSELQLDVLDLGENVLRDLGAAELASAPCLRELKVLELDRCEIELSGARRLAKALFLGNLRCLNVNDNSFGPQGLLALLDANPRELHTLQISNNDLGNEGVSHLTESPASDTLLEVDLSLNRLDFHAAQALAKSKHLKNLLVLRLQDNEISKPAIAALADSPLGKRLAVLDVRDSG
jgi:Ran GTPase-activating protein (RanGAP) involved in mRNA processing and transport